MTKDFTEYLFINWVGNNRDI